MVVELVVVVAVVVEVEVAITGVVSFGHHRPPKMSKIISITLFDKEVVLKKITIDNFTPLLPFVTLPPLPTLYPFHLILIVALLIFCS